MVFNNKKGILFLIFLILIIITIINFLNPILPITKATERDVGITVIFDQTPPEVYLIYPINTSYNYWNSIYLYCSRLLKQRESHDGQDEVLTSSNLTG